MTDQDEGWGSAGLGLEDMGLFGGAERVQTFSDPDKAPEVAAQPPSVTAPDQAPAPAAEPSPPTALSQVPGLIPGPGAFVPDGTQVAFQMPAPQWEPVAAVDPLRAVRAALMDSGPAVAEPAQWGARAVLRRSTRGLLRPGASKAEQAYLGDLETIRTFRWPAPFSVLVTNKKGGVGKTPTTLLLAGVMAQVRSGGVVAFEGAEAAGTLAMRAERAEQAPRGISELLTSMDRIRTAAALAWFTQLQSSGAAVIGSAGDRETLQAHHVRAVRGLLDQYFPISVVDTGNNPESGAFLECVGGAGALVLPTSLAMSSVIGLIDTLFRIRDHGPHGRALAASAVIVVTDDGRPVEAKAAAKARDALADMGVGAVVDVPHDPHIAAGTEISLGRLSVASQRAWVHVTAQVVTVASNNLPTSERTL